MPNDSSLAAVVAMIFRSSSGVAARRSRRTSIFSFSLRSPRNGLSLACPVSIIHRMKPFKAVKYPFDRRTLSPSSQSPLRYVSTLPGVISDHTMNRHSSNTRLSMASHSPTYLAVRSFASRCRAKSLSNSPSGLAALTRAPSIIPVSTSRTFNTGGAFSSHRAVSVSSPPLADRHSTSDSIRRPICSVWRRSVKPENRRIMPKWSFNSIVNFVAVRVFLNARILYSSRRL
ncbi:MAG: hypothetical protein NTZ17_00780 [Phycisphaerae bacterium]|nr:hypothetical protein [Phycisphaerae bacterium]